MHRLTRHLAIAVSLGVARHAVGAAPPVTYPLGPYNCMVSPGYSIPGVCTVTNETPLATFPVPPIGRGYADPNFGGPVRILSGQNITHGYATPSAISATRRYVAVSGAPVSILDALTGVIVYEDRPGSVTGDTLRWDSQDDNVYYYFAGSRAMKHQLSSNQTSVLFDYASAPYAFSSITGGGTGDTSKDNWIGFWAPNNGKVCALDLNSVRTFCADYTQSDFLANVGYSFVDYVMMSKGVDSVSGKRYVLLMANPSIGVFSVNESTGKLDLEYRGPEMPVDMQVSQPGNQDGICDPHESCLSAFHGDTLEDTDGQQYFVASMDFENPCERQINTLRLNARSRILLADTATGGRRSVMTIALCGGDIYSAWSDNHTGCAKLSAYCVFSTNHPFYRDAADLDTTIARKAFVTEVMVMRGNGQEIRRVAQTRSVLFTNDQYWPMARAGISADGGSVVWSTNFGYPNVSVRVVAAETGFAGRITPSVPTADSVSPIDSSGSAATFTFTFSDSRNAANLTTAAMVFGTSTTTLSNSCVVVYDALRRTFQLLWDSGLGSNARPLDSTAVLQNSQCRLGGASVNVMGFSKIITLDVTFKANYNGVKNIYMYGVNSISKATGWKQAGSYTVTPAKKKW